MIRKLGKYNKPAKITLFLTNLDELQKNVVYHFQTTSTKTTVRLMVPYHFNRLCTYSKMVWILKRAIDKRFKINLEFGTLLLPVSQNTV